MKRNELSFAIAVIFGLGLIVNPAVSLAKDRSHGGHSYSGSRHGYSGKHHYRGGHGYRSHRSYSGHRYGYSGHRSRYGYRHHGHGGSAWVPFAILGGAALAYTVSKSADNNYAYNRSYSSPSGYSNSGRHGDGRPCHVVHRVTEEDGGQIKMAATMCYDGQGTSYIVKGSEHVIAQLN